MESWRRRCEDLKIRESSIFSPGLRLVLIHKPGGWETARVGALGIIPYMCFAARFTTDCCSANFRNERIHARERSPIFSARHSFASVLRVKTKRSSCLLHFLHCQDRIYTQRSSLMRPCLCVVRLLGIYIYIFCSAANTNRSSQCAPARFQGAHGTLAAPTLVSRGCSCSV